MARPMVALVAGWLGACQICTDGPRARARADEPLGARCVATGECAAGLTCLEQLCTVGCAGDPAICPAGSSCVLIGICLPGCSADADCQLGSTAARCSGPYPPDPAYCFHVPCDDDAGCPAGSSCVDWSRASGITWNEVCATGWCQRLPGS